MSTSLEIERVAVVGAGFMGSGIAEAAAVSGVPVVLRDVDENSLEAARGRIEGSLARAVKGGKLGPAAGSGANPAAGSTNIK